MTPEEQGREMHRLEQEGRARRCAHGWLFIEGARHLSECDAAPPCEEDTDDDEVGIVVTALDMAMKAMLAASRSAAAKGNWELGLALSPLHTEALQLQGKVALLGKRHLEVVR